jgi:4-phospho-D-threonate 3-dehydrogenase / 4-phospho-D-erythronate 3-dehydrogenase
MAKMLIIADDLTGAADCGVACAAYGINTLVSLSKPDKPPLDAAALQNVAVLSIDADTRSLEPAQAAETVAALIGHYDALRPDPDQSLLFKKVDSTLRGNLAAELAAALRSRRAQVSQPERVVVVFAPASPVHGRTTIQGRQMVHGTPLEETEIGRGERLPLRSNMVEILREAGLASTIVDLALVRAPQCSLESAIIDRANHFDVIVCDAETDADLQAIASASMVLGSKTVWAGSAGLSRHLPRAAGFAGCALQSRFAPVHISGPALFVVGSLAGPSREQARVLAAAPNIVAVTVPYLTLLSDPSSAWQARATSITKSLEQGEDVLVVVDSNNPSTRDLGRLLSSSLARMLEPCARHVGALVATGGETARAILDAWGIDRLHLLGEVEPGLPYSVTECQGREIIVLTKAGGFGTPETLLHCREFLQCSRRSADAPELNPYSPTTRKADMPKPIIAITMGDAAGVGPEIIMKSLAHAQVYEQCRPLVIGDADRLMLAGQLCASQLKVRSLTAGQAEDADYQPGTVDCIDLRLIPPDLPWGRLSPQAGDAAYQYLVVAARLALQGKVGAICTAPLNKEALQAAGHKFPGHTELLAHLTGTPEVSMMLTTPRMKVLHVTTHIGLIDAIARIEPGLVERTIARGHAALEKTGIANPRIGVCGINPHAGENGLFGYGEEEQKIVPAIAACRERGWNVEGPLPADTLFFRAQRGDFDLVIAMYHDQGHGPVKVLGLESGVNITIGLPVVRTSVDHGTAFDIAGTGKADERSLLEAIRQAAQLASRVATVS